MNTGIEKHACSIVKRPTEDDISALVKAAATMIAVGIAILISCVVIERVSGGKSRHPKEAEN